MLEVFSWLLLGCEMITAVLPQSTGRLPGEALPQAASQQLLQAPRWLILSQDTEAGAARAAPLFTAGSHSKVPGPKC